MTISYWWIGPIYREGLEPETCYEKHVVWYKKETAVPWSTCG